MPARGVCIIDLSLKPHEVRGAHVPGAQVAAAAGASWTALSESSRQDAAAIMIEGGKKIVLEKFLAGEIAGAIGIGGANGTNLVCSIMRALPYLVPKVVVSAVAGTAAVQWYVAESDIAMYPSIGDVCAQPHHRVGHGERRAGGGRRGEQTGPRSVAPKPRSPMRRWSQSLRSVARPPASIA